jgi:hypothetical protein
MRRSQSDEVFFILSDPTLNNVDFEIGDMPLHSFIRHGHYNAIDALLTRGRGRGERKKEREMNYNAYVLLDPLLNQTKV